jgi:hypothetical protein
MHSKATLAYVPAVGKNGPKIEPSATRGTDLARALRKRSVMVIVRDEVSSPRTSTVHEIATVSRLCSVP